eukprot:Rmarinus@m.29017
MEAPLILLILLLVFLVVGTAVSIVYTQRCKSKFLRSLMHERYGFQVVTMADGSQLLTWSARFWKSTNGQMVGPGVELAAVLGIPWIRLQNAMPKILRKGECAVPLASPKTKLPSREEFAREKRQAQLMEGKSLEDRWNRDARFIGTALVLAYLDAFGILGASFIDEAISAVEKYYAKPNETLCPMAPRSQGVGEQLGDEIAFGGPRDKLQRRQSGDSNKLGGQGTGRGDKLGGDGDKLGKEGNTNARPTTCFFGGDEDFVGDGVKVHFASLVSQCKVMIYGNITRPGWKRRAQIWRLVTTQADDGSWSLTTDLIAALQLPSSALHFPASATEPEDSGVVSGGKDGGADTGREGKKPVSSSLIALPTRGAPTGRSAAKIKRSRRTTRQAHVRQGASLHGMGHSVGDKSARALREFGENDNHHQRLSGVSEGGTRGTAVAVAEAGTHPGAEFVSRVESARSVSSQLRKDGMLAACVADIQAPVEGVPTRRAVDDELEPSNHRGVSASTAGGRAKASGRVSGGPGGGSVGGLSAEVDLDDLERMLFVVPAGSRSHSRPQSSHYSYSAPRQPEGSIGALSVGDAGEGLPVLSPSKDHPHLLPATASPAGDDAGAKTVGGYVVELLTPREGVIGRGAAGSAPREGPDDGLSAFNGSVGSAADSIVYTHPDAARVATQPSLAHDNGWSASTMSALLHPPVEISAAAACVMRYVPAQLLRFAYENTAVGVNGAGTNGSTGIYRSIGPVEGGVGRSDAQGDRVSTRSSARHSISENGLGAGDSEGAMAHGSEGAGDTNRSMSAGTRTRVGAGGDAGVGTDVSVDTRAIVGVWDRLQRLWATAIAVAFLVSREEWWVVVGSPKEMKASDLGRKWLLDQGMNGFERDKILLAAREVVSSWDSLQLDELENRYLSDVTMREMAPWQTQFSRALHNLLRSVWERSLFFHLLRGNPVGENIERAGVLCAAGVGLVLVLWIHVAIYASWASGCCDEVRDRWCSDPECEDVEPSCSQLLEAVGYSECEDVFPSPSPATFNFGYMLLVVILELIIAICSSAVTLAVFRSIHTCRISCRQWRRPLSVLEGLVVLVARSVANLSTTISRSQQYTPLTSSSTPTPTSPPIRPDDTCFSDATCLPIDLRNDIRQRKLFFSYGIAFFTMGILGTLTHVSSNSLYGTIPSSDETSLSAHLVVTYFATLLLFCLSGHGVPGFGRLWSRCGEVILHGCEPLDDVYVADEVREETASLNSIDGLLAREMCRLVSTTDSTTDLIL